MTFDDLELLAEEVLEKTAGKGAKERRMNRRRFGGAATPESAAEHKRLQSILDRPSQEASFSPSEQVSNKEVARRLRERKAEAAAPKPAAAAPAAAKPAAEAASEAASSTAKAAKKPGVFGRISAFAAKHPTAVKRTAIGSMVAAPVAAAALLKMRKGQSHGKRKHAGVDLEALAQEILDS